MPTLFFKFSDTRVYLEIKSFKLCLCAVKCDCNIQSLALYLSFMLKNSPLTLVEVGSTSWKIAFYIKPIFEDILCILLNDGLNL